MTSPRPLSIQALAARSQPTGYDPSKSLEDLLRIAITEHDAGEQAEAANDTDSAFIHFAKASTLMLTELPNHPKFGELTQSQNEAIVTHGQMMNDSLSAIELLVKKRSLDWRTRHPDTYLSAPAPTLTPHRPISGLTIQQQQRPRPPPQDTHGAGQQARQARQYQEAQRLIDTEQEYGERGQDYKQPQLHQRPPSLLPSQAKRPAVYLQRSLSDSNILLPAPLNTSSNFPPQILASEPLQELQSLRIQPQVEYQHGARADYYPIQPSLKERQHYVVATSRTDLFGPQTKSTRPTSELDTSKQLQPNTFPPVRDQPPHEEFGSGLHPLKDPSITTSKVSGAMPISDVIALLTAHRCPDITSRLDLKKCGATAFFGGGFGDVYQGALDGGEHVAIKCARFYLRQDDEKGHKVLKHAAREIHTWSCLKHDNIVQLLGLAQFRDHLAMISPWMDNGTLLEYLERNPAADRHRLITEITDGVVYLHQNDTVAYFVSPSTSVSANVLISSTGTAKLTDFGCTELKNSTLCFSTTTSYLGLSTRWAAPEILRGDEKRSKSADVYALGMTLLEVITGEIPFSGKNDMAVSFTVCITQRIPDRPPKFPSFDEDQADLLWDMMVSSWAHVSSDRPDSNAMRNWLTGIKPPRLYGGPESIPVYALIIAVNGAGLGAPELDAAKLRSTLASLGITSIDMLVGRAATRQNIIQSLNSVADNPRIPHDAPIIIYYAGHGTQQSINIPGAGPRKVECIVPVDSLSGKPPAPPIPVITISALVSRIAQKKSKHITFIFDCGHSGGFSFPDITSYSLLASCHETQVSQEYGAPPQGLFTTSLLEALAECVEDKILWTVTHAALFERIKAIMQDTQRGNQRALPYPQVPQYVGGIKDRPVFSTSVLPPSSQAITPLVGDPNHGTCLLPLGSLAGVHPQTFFAIYDYPNGWLKLMGKFKVVNLSDSQTMLSIGRIQILPEAYAVMYTPPVALPVEMVGDFPALYNNRSFQNDLISRLGSHEPLDHFVAPVGSGHRSKVRASYSKGQGSVELRNTYGGALHIRNPLRASDALSKAVMFFHHLDQPNLSPLHNSSMFDIRIHELAPAKASDWSAIDHIEVLVPRRDRAPIAMQPTPGGCTVPGSDSSFGLQIINRGAYPFFVHVFYFDPNDYSIASIYLPPGPNVALLPARGELTIGYGDAGASPLSFTIGHHIERDSGFIKVYYSTSPSDMGFIQQDGCEGRRGSHPGDAAHVTSPLSLTVDDNVQKDSGFVKAFSSSYISFIQQDGFDERGDSSPRGAAGEDTSAHGDGRQDAFYGQQTQTQHTRPGTPDTRRDPHYTAHQPSPYPFGSITYPITVTNPRRL